MDQWHDSCSKCCRSRVRSPIQPINFCIFLKIKNSKSSLPKNSFLKQTSQSFLTLSCNMIEIYAMPNRVHGRPKPSSDCDNFVKSYSSIKWDIFPDWGFSRQGHNISAYSWKDQSQTKRYACGCTSGYGDSDAHDTSEVSVFFFVAVV